VSDRLPVSPLVARAIQVAQYKLGLDQLARKMNVSQALLKAWRDGQASMPRADFLALVDLLLDLDISWDDWDSSR